MRKLPYLSGEVQIIKGRLLEAVQQGYPDVGWRGDPLLNVVFCQATEEWQVIDDACSPPKIAVSKKYEGLGDLEMVPALCRKLVAADCDAVTVADRSIAREKAKAEEANKSRYERSIEVARELYPAIRSDLRRSGVL